MSMNPHNGQIKVWVGGANFKHFKYDMVSKGKRQVGSTLNPLYMQCIRVRLSTLVTEFQI